MKFRNIITVTLIAFLFLFIGSAGAYVTNWGEGDLFQQLKTAFGTSSDGHHHDGTDSRQIGESTTNPTFATNIVASGHKSGVTTNVSTESTLTSAALAYGVIALQAGSAKTIGLNDGVPGQMVTIYCSVYDGGAITISKTSFPVTTHSTGWDTIQFTAVNQSVTLLWLDNTSGWVIVGEPDAAVTFATMTSSGTVTAGSTVTAGTGITSTTGNITASAGDVLFRSTVYAVGNKTGVTTNVSTESNLTSAALAYGVIKLQAGSAKSISIANGTKGQMVSIIMTVYDGATITLTDDQVAAGTFTKTGWDDIAFSAVGHQVTLLYVDDTVGWVIVGYYGVTITQ